jgi:co-chaperonin GroES (HSP10)
MKLYAKNGYLVCEPYELTNKNTNSLLIQNANANNVAKIIEKGETNSLYAIDYEVNDIILYNTDEAKEYILNGNKYVIVDAVDVFAIIKEDE